MVKTIFLTDTAILTLTLPTINQSVNFPTQIFFYTAYCYFITLPAFSVHPIQILA